MILLEAAVNSLSYNSNNENKQCCMIDHACYMYESPVIIMQYRLIKVHVPSLHVRGVAIWSVGGGVQIGRESLSSFTEPKGISERSELIRGESVSEGNHPVARGIIQQPWAMGGHSAPASRVS